MSYPARPNQLCPMNCPRRLRRKGAVAARLSESVPPASRKFCALDRRVPGRPSETVVRAQQADLRRGHEDQAAFCRDKGEDIRRREMGVVGVIMTDVSDIENLRHITNLIATAAQFEQVEKLFASATREMRRDRSLDDPPGSTSPSSQSKGSSQTAPADSLCRSFFAGRCPSLDS